MHKVGIIGLGHVGATLAYSLVTEGLVDELVLIDKDEQLAVSQEYDLLDAQVFLPTKTAITIQDYHALKNASILVFVQVKSVRWVMMEIVLKNLRSRGK
ncbi:NAD(P)-binding domain-containing protein [Enterococcus termitis]